MKGKYKMPDLSIKVSIEKCINKAVAEFAQHIFTEHNIRLNSINILWQDISTVEKQDFVVSRICMDTTTEI